MRNVISYRKAGKGEHGKRHWFWAVWINVESVAEWNGQKPNASGYAKNKSTADQAAWEALKARTHHHQACYSGWAWHWLQELKSRDTRPLFSRFSVGRNRWYWTVGEFLEEPIATGVAESAERAIMEAEKQLGPVRQTGNWMAKSHWRKQRAIQRAQSASDDSSASPLEFVYECHSDYSDYDGERYDSVVKYRIVKKTKKRIFVDRNPYRENSRLTGKWYDWDQSTFVLDRQQFDTTGKANRSGRWCRTYYSDPSVYHAEQAIVDCRLQCFVTLEVEQEPTESLVKSAYRRLAKLHHPDVGGDPEKFKRVRLAYEEAMAIVSG